MFFALERKVHEHGVTSWLHSPPLLSPIRSVGAAEDACQRAKVASSTTALSCELLVHVLEAESIL